MLSRRHALKIAAGLTAGRLGISAVTPAEAATLLDQPLDAGDPLGLPPGTHDLDDPAAFADRLHWHHDFDDHDHSLFDYIAPEEHAAFAQNRAAIYASLPFLRDLPFDHPFTKMEDRILDWVLTAYGKGLSDGAAYEHLRVALTGPTRLCNACDGYGVLEGQRGIVRPGTREPANPTPCPDCKGRGIIPSALPVAGLHTA